MRPPSGSVLARPCPSTLTGPSSRSRTAARSAATTAASRPYCAAEQAARTSATEGSASGGGSKRK